MRKDQKRAIWFGAAAAAVLGTAALVAASPGAQAGTTVGAGKSVVTTAAVAAASTVSPVYPAFVKLPADQAAHPDAANEWWYVVGRAQADGHVFGYEVDIIPRSNIAGASTQSPPEALVAISDVTTGQYFDQSFVYSPSQGTFSATTLDESTPNASLSGPLNAMHLQATMPSGTIDLTLDAKGPALYNGGTGLVPFITGSSYYYSLPTLATTGTIVESGKTYKVSGLSWLDHQWGDWNWTGLDHWTWMGVHLSNGVSIDLGDVFTGGTESFPVTVLQPDGTEELVTVDPLAAGTSGFVTSPVTGQTYGTKWQVKIPALHASLTVTASPKLQEIQGIYEGASTVTGTYEGKAVTGQAEAEQLGNWHKAS